MGKKTGSVHDSLFKQVFSHCHEVLHFIKGSFPESFTAKMNLQTLSLSNTSYITRGLQKYYSDVVYDCMYGQQNPIKIVFLFEHKTEVPEYPHLQLLQYMVNAWNTLWQKQKQKLIPIIPVVVYHGLEKWEVKPFHSFFENIDEDIKYFIPLVNYKLIDLRITSDEEINEKYESVKLRISLLQMRHIYDLRKSLMFLKIVWYELNKMLKDDPELEFFEALYVHLLKATGHKPEEVEEIVENFNDDEGETIMGTIEKLFKHHKDIGKQEGRLEGEVAGIDKSIIIINLINEGKTDQAIAEQTGVSIEIIERLRDGLLGKKVN